MFFFPRVAYKFVLQFNFLSKSLEYKWRSTIMKFGIEKCVMLIIQMWKKRNDGRNRTTKSGKSRNSWRKRILQVPGKYWKQTVSNKCDTMKGVRQANDPFVCFGAKPDKGFGLEISTRPEVGKRTPVRSWTKELREVSWRQARQKGS